ncbi:MAG: hypothetical protein AABX93_00145 [Nanoarchaeota archaeon]
MKPKFVYHGSSKKLVGDKLVPKQAKDVDGVADNSHLGVYASEFKDEAMAMGILNYKSVDGGEIRRFRKLDGAPGMDAIIYNGFPRQKYFYLYTLPSRTFANVPKGSLQWVSKKTVIPVKIERLSTKKYLYLIRRASPKEREEWNKNVNNKKNKLLF